MPLPLPSSKLLAQLFPLPETLVFPDNWVVSLGPRLLMPLSQKVSNDDQGCLVMFVSEETYKGNAQLFSTPTAIRHHKINSLNIHPRFTL